ncbi:MAG TPA: carboxypeptidase-like regulatory domain-containing protein [Gemmatimonadaceae bacterium]|nr:carboxypeptidase-like regulatory domain-containing protein [Gemmatimonadaceae bacterium]
MASWHVLVIASVTCAVSAATLPAQLTVPARGSVPAPATSTIITGLVRDSLSGKPLAGASIQLFPAATPTATGRMVSSDSIGRYRIDSVAPGQYVVGFLHPRLDSLGLDPISRTIDVDPGVRYLRADLAIPAGRSLVAAFCGPRTDSTGAVFGRVLDASTGMPLAGGSVVVRFAELRVDASGMRKVQARAVAPFAADGRYVACGIPTDAPVLVQARSGSGDAGAATALSGEIEITFDGRSPIVHRDLLIGVRSGTVAAAGSAPAAATAVRNGTARLAGRVLGGTGAPVSGARIRVQDTESTATSDSSGAFRLTGLPAGTQTIEVIAIGYAPARASADLRPDRETAVTIDIGARVATLAAVMVKAAPDRAGFSTRRTQGQGYFLDAAQIEQRSVMNISTALSTVPSLRNNGFDTANPTRPRISGRGNCTPSAYLDGMQMREGIGSIDDLLTVRRVGAIEVYANPAEAPGQFRGNGNCAVIVVWSKSYVP